MKAQETLQKMAQLIIMMVRLSVRSEWEHPNYVMSINAQKGKKAFVITILVPITQFREPLKIYELPKRLAI
jgi:hypothetical protein